jgi:hypothetical protein
VGFCVYLFVVYCYCRSPSVACQGGVGAFVAAAAMRRSLLPTGITIVREYTSQQEYTEDAGRLARLGYVVMSVIELPLPQGWVQWARRVLFLVSANKGCVLFPVLVTR